MNSNHRVAEILIRLVNGDVVTYDQFGTKYNISLRTFQRDLANVKEVLSDNLNGQQANLVLNRDNGSYQITFENSKIEAEIVLAISRILIGSRALASNDLEELLQYLQRQLSPQFVNESMMI